MQCEYIVLLPSIYYYSCILLQQPKVQDLYNYYIVARDCQLAFKAGCIYTSFAGIAAGLSHIHGKGILHNDLKADNVALSDCLPASNEAPVPRLWPTIVDFGKACPSEKGKMYVLGSRQKEMYRSRFSHIAPDLVDGIVRQSYLSDVFSFGQLIGRVAHLRTTNGLQQLAVSCTMYSCSDRLQLENIVSTLKSML